MELQNLADVRLIAQFVNNVAQPFSSAASHHAYRHYLSDPTAGKNALFRTAITWRRSPDGRGGAATRHTGARQVLPRTATAAGEHLGSAPA